MTMGVGDVVYKKKGSFLFADADRPSTPCRHGAHHSGAARKTLGGARSQNFKQAPTVLSSKPISDTLHI